jgi:hypothetical protein
MLLGKIVAGRSSRLLSVENREKSHVSAVALLIRQAWQNGLVPGSVATLLDEPGILTEKAEDVSGVDRNVLLISEPCRSTGKQAFQEGKNANNLSWHIESSLSTQRTLLPAILFCQRGMAVQLASKLLQRLA